jgi:apolipoprotein N-acyltransferase
MMVQQFRSRTMRLAWVAAMAVSAAGYALAFPPASLAPLIFVALVPLFVVLARLSPARAALLGALFAVLAAAGLAYWLPGMLRDFFGVPATLSLAATLGVFVVFAGTWWASFGAYLSWLARRGRASPLAVGAGFGACEFARANLLIPDPWALSVYSQLASPLAQTADLAGPYGVGLLVGGVNAAIAGIFSPALRGRSCTRSLAGAALALTAAWSYGTWRLAQSFGDAERAVAVEVVHIPDVRRHSVISLASGFAAAPTTADLVLWPEGAIDFPLRDPSPQTNALLRLARESDADWLVGGPDYRSDIERVHSFNSLFLMQRGRLSGQIDKIQLMPFAETNPLKPYVELERADLTPGSRIRTLPLRGVRVGAAICSEAMDPEHVRRVVAAGAELLVNPAKDAWFGNPAAAEMQLDIARLRAIESRRWLARAAAGGVSAVVDPWGRVVARADGRVATRLNASLAPSQSVTPYQRCGDLVAWLAVLVAAGASVLPIRPQRRSSEVSSP